MPIIMRECIRDVFMQCVLIHLNFNAVFSDTVTAVISVSLTGPHDFSFFSARYLARCLEVVPAPQPVGRS